MAKFSIIIPVYNVEKYLDVCVESVLCQSFTDFEVLLIDDGATDSSGTMCDAWAAKDSRIRVIHQANQGLSGARNTGIREATGDYLMFLDSDDWWAGPEVLSRIVARLRETGAEVLSLNYQKVWSNGNNQTYLLTEPIPENMYFHDLASMTVNQLWIACAWNKVISRSLFLRHDLLFVPKIVSEDIDWSLRLAICANRFAYLEDVSVCYRQRAGSLCHEVSAARVKGLFHNVTACLQILHKAEQGRATLLQPFVAYQYATLLYNCAELPKKLRNVSLYSEIKALRWLLEESENSKVKLLRIANRLLGFDGMLLALRCRQRIMKGQ